MEQLYYRTIFDNLYPGQDHLIPYFWMPKYVDATDSSARSLDIYSLDTINEGSDENISDDSQLLTDLDSIDLDD
jgi:asparagine synthase (glutamine-hydrolysing)